MTKEEILHLGTLSRMRLSDAEAEKLKGEIDSILDYIGQVNELVDDGHLEKKVGLVHNVFRDDEVTNEPGSYSGALTAAFPEREGNYLKVKKILNPDS
ncbi:hypothetical protein A2837_00035 [Candidatus Kaiserbacteria bacterium RIFCSPHIGHO2_01_FULL_46_22]|uniref:Aspartyl/glutamyl-tRNA(Asn/Gln) amidotransferase subunit C n=1 Tax=Candidatus Kaiserbacteria bacterium RIFCSPHIGHO2_01_FULL_46_22 TaxID=1798475 RepID=A0A1F6BYS1_9BACT|nr:MAG: hypothetical protein A2837_00035 [Candidatus Kaiserbacteria bacterium RIFCSPHIGHO2_01_FULL_46_22]